MNGQTVFLVIVLTITGLALANMIYGVVKNRGLKGALFHARVGRQIFEMHLPRRGILNTKVKVHVLEPRDPHVGPHVGVEVVTSTIGSWHMTPLSLTRGEALELAEALSRAAKDSESGPALLTG